MRERERRVDTEVKTVRSFREFVKSIKSLPGDPKFASIGFVLRDRFKMEDKSNGLVATYDDERGWIDLDEEEGKILNLEELTVGENKPERLDLITKIKDWKRGNAGFRNLRDNVIARFKDSGYVPDFAFFETVDGKFLHFRFNSVYSSRSLT